MSDTNRVRLLMARESSYGVLGGSPSWNEVRFTGESLVANVRSVRSNEIRADRMVPDLVRVGRNSTGSVNLELSYGTYDLVLESGLQSAAWTTPVTITAGTDVSFVASTGTLNDVSAGLTALAVGDWIKISGAANAGNNGVFLVKTKASNGVITVAPNTFVDESAGASITIIKGAYIKNGTTFTSFAVEKQFTDVANTFEYFAGIGIDKLNLAVKAGQIVTGSFDVMGSTVTNPTSTAAGSYTAANSNSVLNAVDNVIASIENNATAAITEMTIATANNMRERNQVGSLDTVSLGSGSFNATGSIMAYFSSGSIYDRFLNNTTTNVAQVFRDSAGQQIVMHMPAIKIATGKRVAGSGNADVMADLTYEAIRDPNTDEMVRFTRFV